MWRLLILPVLLAYASKADAAEDVVKVFVLAGQSNMQGQGVVDLDHPEYYNGGKGTLIWAMEKGKTKAKMRRRLASCSLRHHNHLSLGYAFDRIGHQRTRTLRRR